MQLTPDQLAASLGKGVAPVYFICGDEPLQLCEAGDAVRRAARNAGYEAREILSTDTPGFSWAQLAEAADTGSIFADKKIIDLRLPAGTVGADGAKALQGYCERLPMDTLLLISAGKVAKEAFKTRWLQALDKQGIIVNARPLEGRVLQDWMQRRLQRQGLAVDSEGLGLLLTRSEGNLLAAAQEIEKLFVLYGGGALNAAQIADAVADSARYDVYKLVDAVLAARVGRILKILAGLRQDGVAAPIVLWALTREARTLISIKQALAAGQNKERVFRDHQIWDKRKPLVGEALTRLGDSELQAILLLAAQADRQSKGQQPGDAWVSLQAMCLLFASLPSVNPAICGLNA